MTCRPSIFGYRGSFSLAIKVNSADSSLEEAGFELSVPLVEAGDYVERGLENRCLFYRGPTVRIRLPNPSPSPNTSVVCYPNSGPV
jgi:hypothetical protein